MDSRAIRAMQRHDEQRVKRFLQQLRSSNRHPKFNRPGLAAFVGAGGRNSLAAAAQAQLDGLRGTWSSRVAPLVVAGWALARKAASTLAGWPWRRLAAGSGAAVVTVAALAATQVVAGYHDFPPDHWQQRLQQRLGSAIFSSDGQLQGSIFPAALPGTGPDPANYGYIPLQGSLPPVWRASALALEQKSAFDPWRSVCGIDVLGIAKRVLTGSGGGSGFAQQNAKNLLAPDFVRRQGGLGALVDKLREMGAACSLHRALGGAEGMLNLYAAYAPVAQVGGVTRGVEAGARVIFNAAPAEAQPFQQAVLAALVQRPLSITPVSAFQKGCPVLRSTPSAQLSREEIKAASQCHVLARARVALRAALPPGPELEAQIAQVNALEATGIVPANPFDPLPTRRLVNLSSRTRASLSPALVARVAEEAEAVDVPAGSPLTLTMAQPEQFGFGLAARQALKDMDASTAGRETLCLPLAFGGPVRRCPGTPDAPAQADIVLARMAVDNGAITRLYESSRLAFDANNAMGSLAKMVIALVAVRNGYTAQTLVCPRRARDGGRLLRRITRPVHGYTQCGPGQMISFAEAMARSDNLAAYEVARSLPPAELRRGVEALGLRVDPERDPNLAFALAFGTLPATPSQLLAMGQALFGVAYGAPVRSGGPRLLASTRQPAPAYRAVRAWLREDQAAQLRELLQAPAQHPQGTLRHLLGTLQAGKTGTTSAPYGPYPGARPYLQARYTLAYVPADRSVVLAVVHAPAGHALGLHSLDGQLLAPAMKALLQ